MKSPFESVALADMPFRLESVSVAPDPDGGTALWHRYVITQGADPQGGNTIVGLRSGSRDELLPQLEALVERLNERFGRKQAKAR